MSLFRTKSLSELMPEEGEGGLKRALTASNLVLLGIGAIIGAGIFVLTGTAAEQYAGPAIVLSFVLAGTPPAARPIGVFDSDIGGLSVLQALRHELPHEDFIYLADSGNAPYGDKKGEAFVKERTLAIARWLLQQHHIKALVVACNTATAAAVERLRASLPDLPEIGVEPALKPAAARSQTHHVGVLATRGTVGSARFERLREQHSAHTRFAVQACDGLARAIEQSTEEPLPAL